MSLFSVVTDLGRVAMAVGLQRIFRGIMEGNPVWGQQFEAYRIGGREAELAGAASELALLGRASALLDIQHVGGDRTLIERVAQSGAENMQMVNLMAPATQLGQRFAGALLQSEMVELSVKLADKAISAEELVRLRAFGMDDAMARRIAAEWRTAGAEERGQLRLANTEGWQDRELVRRFRGALATAVDSAVMRPNVADRPNFLSAPVAQGLLLYKGFSIAASQRFLMAGLQQRDAYVLSGVVSATALAWIFQGPAGGAYDRHPIFSLERLVTAVEKSGAVGLLSDVNHALEMASGNQAGIRPLLGVDPPSFMRNPTWAQQAAVVGGATVSPMLNVIWAMTDPRARGDQQAGAIRRAIWFNNLIWWDWAVRGVTREIGTAIGNPPRPSARPPAVSGFAGGVRSGGE